MRIVAALGLCIALVAPLHAQAQAQGGTAMDARLTAFATHDGLARAVAFDRFDKEVPAAARADALVAMWSAADARPDRDLARESILAYLVGKSVHDLPWSDALRALAKSAAVSPAAEQRRLALGAMIKRDGATEMRDPIVHALDDQSEPVRDLAIGEVARWPDHQALLSGYVKRNQSKKAHANTLERARFLIQRDGIK